MFTPPSKTGLGDWDEEETLRRVLAESMRDGDGDEAASSSGEAKTSVAGETTAEGGGSAEDEDASSDPKTESDKKNE
jgi:hypothetical protein